MTVRALAAQAVGGGAGELAQAATHLADQRAGVLVAVLEEAVDRGGGGLATHSGLTPVPAAARQTADPSGVLPERIRNGDATLAETETWYLQRALQRCDGNLAAAARVLGVDRSTVARKVKR